MTDELRADTGAPIVLVTGNPGAGKTLRALAEFAVGKTNVFQWNINGCELPQHDPHEWDKLPPGSTLIVDEAREVYPPASPTKEPPKHYQLHKIRHTGISLVIICQHPNDIDARVRRLVGRHLHVVRIFGAEKAMVHEWAEAKSDIDNREDSIKVQWQYPPEVFKLYKSAELHRMAPRVPLRVRAIKWLIAAAVLALPVAAWIIYKTLMPADAQTKPNQTATPTPFTRPTPPAPPGETRSRGPARLTSEQIAESYTPAITGMPHTAPRYADLTEPQQAPYPAACVATRDRCKCYTQQATPITMPEITCRDIVKNGIFIDFLPAQAQPAVIQASTPTLPLTSAPVSATAAPPPPGTLALKF